VISLETARQLLDFAGGTVAQKARLGYAAAESQLEGAVALHNILEAKRVAYLADEVGLGKTYVALGAFALFRHFNPKFRLLVIAPKENIQRKWIKELRNFVRNNIRFPDLRVKSLQDTPARSPVYCSNLYELVRETSIDPDRDFFARLTSFSFGLAEDSEGWRKRRDRLLALLPWIDADLFDLRNKERFKQNYARAVCCAIPAFDLVIIDEGHNLKHGLQRSASLRNHLLALTFGNDNGEGINRRTLPYYGRRARRVLFLSATPLEEDYYQIWNQLDVVGFGEAEPSLCDPNISDEQKREALSSFLIRRVSSVQVAGEQLTKNLYRREWRSGGVAIHDESLPVPDERQRLVVALIQKKVSELLASERFNNSFQIGMLASFESFLRTAKVAANGADGTFDDSQQTDDFIEREGIDVDAVNRLTDSYKRHFYRPMPHPKMDALVDTLRSSFDTGKKALVFVRRVASVKEIKGKLDDEYDAWLFRRLRTELLPSLQDRLEKLIERYRSERATRKQTSIEATPVDGSVEEDDLLVEEDDRGDIDTFFAWYFRGDGPSDVLSGAAIAKRFIQSRFALSSFFSDNYVAELLGARPGAVFQALVAYTGMSESVLKTEVEGRAGSLLRADQKKRRHYDLFFAFQHSAISLLAETAGRLQHDASIVLDTVFQGAAGGETGAVPLGDWLERPTFFTELRDKPELLHEIWMPAEESHLAFAPGFKRRELRRELVASMFRLGHSFIDLYIAIINQLGRIGRDGAAEDLDNQALARGVLAVLEHQRCSNPFRAYHELREASANFDLILDVNAPRLWELPIESVSIEIGKLLRAQQPVGGMSGQVNQTLVRQFRMPAYPFVLIATDLLQEGEDLHLFCSDVYHYGIAWVPSAMEQRIGRIDRVRSQTERRLASATGYPDGQDLLQVYYPHLRETVEVFQVNRVLDRMTRFIKLMHENLVAPEDDHDPKINVVHEIQQKSRVSEISREPLRSAFPVARSLLKGPRKPLPVSNKLSQDLLQRFACIQDELEKGGVMWHPRTRNNSRIGSMHRGDRKQAFTIFLYSIHGYPNLRCVSPIGQIDPEVEHEIISREARLLPVRVAAVYDARFNHYKLTAEADVLLGHCVADVSRALWLVKMTTGAADLLEDVLLHLEQDVHGFTEDLDKEPQVER
jgi:superfamily II DNA or RNA helicase